MKCHTKAAAIVVLCTCITSTGATLRPEGDPGKSKIIWGDQFDNYSQWAWDNRDNTAYTRGTLWQGGPIPAGSGSGGWPTKSEDTTGCGVGPQESPAPHEMARAQWISGLANGHPGDCPTILSPGNLAVDRGAFEANYDGNCGISGEFVSTRGMFATLNYTWGEGGSRSSMAQFSHNFADRIQAIATYNGLNPTTDPRNAVNGSDSNPLIVVFYISDGAGLASNFDNMYVELSFGDDKAPTDYIWRGNPTGNAGTDPEACPQGPYPIICQQVREINSSVSEDGGDLTYLNTHCPALTPAFDPETQTGRTWSSFAFGFLAILDKDPCGLAEQGADAHKPTADHAAVFDGNKWRQIRAGRYTGLASPMPHGPQFGANPGRTWPPEDYMNAGSGSCNDFTTGTGTHIVYLKIMTDYVLVYMWSNVEDQHWGAAIPRIYKGGFDTVRLGVGPGCELDPATGQCRAGGTPTQCLTYSTSFGGYNRTKVDSMSIFGAPTPTAADQTIKANLVYIGSDGACCHSNGTCEVTDQATCTSSGGRWDGRATVCGQYRCCSELYGDTDQDNDVDMVDFAEFQRCLTTGPGSGGGANPVAAGCECLDSENDGDIDGNDAIHFATCATGEGIAGDPNCKNW
jgi:hypothetical protein